MRARPARTATGCYTALDSPATMEDALPETVRPASPDAGRRTCDSPELADTLRGEPPANLGDVLEAPPGSGPAEAFHQRARLAEDRLAEVLAAYRKLKAENEDGSASADPQPGDGGYQQRHEKLLLKFIDILDNLDRALEAAETSYARPAPDRRA